MIWCVRRWINYPPNSPFWNDWKKKKIVASFLLYIFFLLHTTCSHTVHEYYYFLKLCWRRPKKKEDDDDKKIKKRWTKKEYWKFIQNNPSSEWTDKTLENYAAALKMPKKITMRLFFVPLFNPPSVPSVFFAFFKK